MGDDRRGRGLGVESLRIGDLMVLVTGMALALAMHEIFSEDWISAARVPEPWASALRVAEYVSKFNIALALMVVVRRIRSEGMFRPAEWLILVNAMRSVYRRLLFGGGMTFATGLFGGAVGRFRAWYALGLLGLMAVTIPLLVGGARRPRWLRLSLLATLPLFAFWGPIVFASHELDAVWDAIWPDVPFPSITRALFFGLMQAPEHILVCVPFVASLRDLARRGRSEWSWIEWAGLAAALLTGVGGVLQILAAGAVNFPDLAERLLHWAIKAGWWAVDLAVAWALVRALAGPWTRWTDPAPAGE
jgi:hypothetical protein